MFDGITLPRIIVEIAVGVDAQTIPSLWSEVTPDVDTISVRRGRDRELDTIPPGECTIVLDNARGEYDPTNVLSSFYNVDHSEIRPMIQVRVSAEWETVTYPLFRGYVTDFDFDFGQSPTCSLICNDALFLLAQVDVSETLPTDALDSEDVRIGRLLDVVSWPTDLRALDPGQTQLTATTYGDNALSLAQKAAFTANGLLFVDSSGVVTFFNRHRVYTQDRSTNAQASLSDDAAAETDYYTLSVEYSTDSIANDIRAKRNDELAIEQVATDADSVALYGKRGLPGSGDMNSLEITTDSEVKNFAQYLLGRFHEPDLRVTGVEIDIASQPQVAATVMGLTLLDRISVERRYASRNSDVGPFVRELLVQGISIDIDAESFVYRLNTVSPDRMVAFILDVSRLDVGQLTY